MSDYVQAMETDLYLTLGIDDDANEAEIKCAFEKLEQIMNEDENLKHDDDAIREFAEAKHAFEILSNPDSKMVYDKFGRDAVENYLEVQHATPERVQLMVAEGNMPKVMTAVIVAALLMLVFLILVTAKIDGKYVGWDWELIFIPLQVLFAALSCCFFVGFFGTFCRSDVHAEELPPFLQGTYRITALFLIAILPLFAVLFFLLMLPHKLDKTVDWPWFTVFLPIYYFPLRDFIQALMLRENKIREDLDPGIPAALSFLWMLLKYFVLTAFVLKLSGGTDWTWRMVATPVLIYLGLAIVTSCASFGWQYRHSQQTFRLADAGIATYDEALNAQADTNQAFATCLSAVLPMSVIIGSFVLELVDYLEGGEGNVALVFMPIWVMFGCVFLCSCCTLYFTSQAYAPARGDLDDEEDEKTMKEIHQMAANYNSPQKDAAANV